MFQKGNPSLGFHKQYLSRDLITVEGFLECDIFYAQETISVHPACDLIYHYDTHLHVERFVPRSLCAL